jgi:hypothetical protein
MLWARSYLLMIGTPILEEPVVSVPSLSLSSRALIAMIAR